MSAFAPTIEAFFTERLITQCRVSPSTVESYRDTLRLLFVFAEERLGKAPSSLDVTDVDYHLVSSFLSHLEQDRGNAPRTRNTRLAAVHSLFRYAALRHPEHAGSIHRVLSIPSKRHDRREVNYLEVDEVDALLAAPDTATWLGRRDHALLTLAVQTGLRVSELTRLDCGDVELGRGAYVHCHGKGRKERSTPLIKVTVKVLGLWMKERAGQPLQPLFPTLRGTRLSPDAVQWLVAKHADTAGRSCLSMAQKTISPHVLRHTCAMNLLHSGVDVAVIALWLGHESTQTTQMYLHADMGIKGRAIARTAPPHTKPGRYRPPDRLLAFLDGL